MQRRRLLIASIASTALVLGGGAAYAILPKHFARIAACESIRAVIDERGDVVHAQDGGTHVFVLGDSYTSGDTLEERTDAWVYQLPASLDWSIDFSGVGMTGFTNGGYCEDGSYPDRLASLTIPEASLFVIEGGLNDTAVSEEELRAGLADTLRAVPAGMPVVIIGPVAAPNSPNAPKVDRILADEATELGATYVSAINWDLEFGPDGLHLTPAGHSAYARQLSAALA
ncbi:SGNH/GDSL hydrolase family protein [Plantibacter auratus]|uniref:SGNH/GDSL hydrolase family protein n=1 Tax=Plantibacter auratus TaxID=272914 RepID=UPI003D341B0B